jgi:transposase InsO family protein
MLGQEHFPVKSICKAFGRSSQAYYKANTQIDRGIAELDLLIRLAIDQRKEYPNAGCRYMYGKFGDKLPFGRDKTERLLLSLGFRTGKRTSYPRTTKAGRRVYKNLLANGLWVTGINQVWQGDMTYYLTKQKPLYIIFLTDVYSQLIVGYHATDNQRAEGFLKAFRMAQRTRRGQDLSGLIHHSDRGGQYSSTLYAQALTKAGIIPSMSKYSWENPYAEKVNDLIKNGYLNHWLPQTLEQLRIDLKRAVINYNTQSQKKVLGKRSPLDFEKQLTLKTKHYELWIKPTEPKTQTPDTITKTTNTNLESR